MGCMAPSDVEKSLLKLRVSFTRLCRAPIHQDPAIWTPRSHKIQRIGLEFKV